MFKNRILIIKITLLFVFIIGAAIVIPISNTRYTFGCPHQGEVKTHYSLLKQESEKFNELPVISGTESDIMPGGPIRCFEFKAKLYIL